MPDGSVVYLRRLRGFTFEGKESVSIPSLLAFDIQLG
jgi:hypothetical protein